MVRVASRKWPTNSSTSPNAGTKWGAGVLQLPELAVTQFDGPDFDPKVEREKESEPDLGGKSKGVAVGVRGHGAGGKGYMSPGERGGAGLKVLPQASGHLGRSEGEGQIRQEATEKGCGDETPLWERRVKMRGKGKREEYTEAIEMLNVF